MSSGMLRTTARFRLNRPRILYGISGCFELPDPSSVPENTDISWGVDQGESGIGENVVEPFGPYSLKIVALTTDHLTWEMVGAIYKKDDLLTGDAYWQNDPPAAEGLPKGTNVAWQVGAMAGTEKIQTVAFTPGSGNRVSGTVNLDKIGNPQICNGLIEVASDVTNLQDWKVPPVTFSQIKCWDGTSEVMGYSWGGVTGEGYVNAFTQDNSASVSVRSSK